jgi:hypothetical protein
LEQSNQPAPDQLAELGGLAKSSRAAAGTIPGFCD